MKTFFLLGCALLLAGCSGAAETQKASKASAPSAAMTSELPTLSGDNLWTVDYSASTLQFTAVHAGNEFTGHFQRFAAAIQLDPDTPEDGQVHVIVDMASVDAKDDDRNANLPEKDWFHTKAFSYAAFKSSDISNGGGNNYVANGSLSIKGITQPTQLSFTLDLDGDTALASGSAVLMRQDFKLGTDSADFKTEEWVGFPVTVNFVIKASR